MKKGISASMMCADIMHLKDDILVLEKSGIDYLHIDIMDGEFVPNYTYGKDYIEAIRNNTDTTLDIHLMVDKPEIKIDYLPICEGDCVSIHVESCVHLQRLLSALKLKGINTGVAFNPATGIESLKHVLDVIDFVLIMTVNPGFAGQQVIARCMEKIKETRELLDSSGYNHILIEVDGNVSYENVPEMKRLGADIFVVGSSSIFDSTLPLEEATKKFRKMIE